MPKDKQRREPKKPKKKAAPKGQVVSSPTQTINRPAPKPGA